MARELQCPNCRARHALADHAHEASFACSSCGRLLRVPDSVRSAPPRRRDATVVAGGGGTAALPAVAAASAKGPSKPMEPSTVSRSLRVLAWAAALVLGGFLTFTAARAVGYLSGDRALDLVLEEGIRRYTVLLPLVPIWAVLTTVFVTLFLDGRRAWRSRRGGRSSSSSAGPAYEPVAAATASVRSPKSGRGAGVASQPLPPRRPTEGRRAGGGQPGRAED
jgi:hypothetical protein